MDEFAKIPKIRLLPQKSIQALYCLAILDPSNSVIDNYFNSRSLPEIKQEITKFQSGLDDSSKIDKMWSDLKEIIYKYNLEDLKIPNIEVASQQKKDFIFGYMALSEKRFNDGRTFNESHKGKISYISLSLMRDVKNYRDRIEPNKEILVNTLINWILKQ